MTDKEAEEIAKTKVKRLLHSGMMNSGILGATFVMWTIQGYVVGSYWLVGFGAFASYLCISDAISFYKFKKGLAYPIESGEDNG